MCLNKNSDRLVSVRADCFSCISYCYQTCWNYLRKE